jgi:hypothetical protein
MNKAQKNRTSTDYADLIARLRQGECVECMIDFGVWKGSATAAYKNGVFGDLFTLTTHNEPDVIYLTTELAFIEFCSKNGVLFAPKDFLGATRRLLEIARNAAEFKAVSVPLNTVEDVDALLALMGSENAG